MIAIVVITLVAVAGGLLVEWYQNRRVRLENERRHRVWIAENVHRKAAGLPPTGPPNVVVRR